MSTSTKYEGHTPGPWIATFDENGGYDCMTSAWHVKSEYAYVTIVDCGKKGNDLATEADAALIADAPALLAERDTLKAENTRLREALTQAVNCMRLHDNDNAGLCAKFTGIIELGESALAAGKGETR